MRVKHLGRGSVKQLRARRHSQPMSHNRYESRQTHNPTYVQISQRKTRWSVLHRLRTPSMLSGKHSLIAGLLRHAWRLEFSNVSTHLRSPPLCRVGKPCCILSLTRAYPGHSNMCTISWRTGAQPHCVQACSDDRRRTDFHRTAPMSRVPVNRQRPRPILF